MKQVTDLKNGGSGSLIGYRGSIGFIGSIGLIG
jgi:hypothetical protein